MPSFTLALALLAALTERGEVNFTPRSDEASVPALFQLAPAIFPFDMRLTRDLTTCRVWSVTFPSPVESPDPANNTIHGDYFQPKRIGRRPGIVVLHILGSDFALSRYLSLRLADRGVAAIFIRLPYYGERRPVDADRRFLSADLDRSMLAMRQGICDVRRSMTWLASRPEIDPSRLGVTGISLGGMVSAVVAGIDPTVNRAALLLAGGGLDTILWDMPEPEARRYHAAWVASGRTREDLARITRPFDPLTYATGMKNKHVMMIAGKVDEVVPPSAASALWEAAGMPEIIWYDCGHYSAVGYLIPAIEKTANFLAEK
jgi:cephalosporin-C deacetylase-like acetyl esterase